jgi:hypothetical protein
LTPTDFILPGESGGAVAVLCCGIAGAQRGRSTAIPSGQAVTVLSSSRRSAATSVELRPNRSGALVICWISISSRQYRFGVLPG